MNFNHRVADMQDNSLGAVLRRIQYPMSILIPIGLTVLNYFSIKDTVNRVGQWQTGGFSTAFMPLIVRILAGIFNMGEENLLHIIIIAGYLFASITFYIFIYFLSKRHLPAIIAGLATMLPLMPFSQTSPERLILAITGSDGAHMIGLTIIPIAAIFFLKYLRSGKIVNLILFGSLTLVITLISFFSLLIMVIFMLLFSLSEALIGMAHIKFFRLLLGVLVILGELVIVYNATLIKMLVSEEGRTTISVLTNALPVSFVVLPVLGTFAFLIFDRRPQLQPLFIAFSTSVIFGLFHLVRTLFMDIPVLNTDRFGAEVSFCSAFFLGIVAMWLFELIRTGKIFTKNEFIMKYRELVAVSLVTSIIGMYLGLILFGARGIG